MPMSWRAGATGNCSSASSRTGIRAAFAALVKRHGTLVFGICRRILHDHELAQDAFQAVFIILAKKAGAIRKRDALPSWLFGVAQRVARQALRRRQREQSRLRVAAESRRQDERHDRRWEETLALLEEELSRLPRWYQAPLLACYLQGRTQDEAARELGWPLATLRRRLE
jgi:RNA polymerase sigma factor (sigma-70 family)